ncbi:hypothetical protein N7539_009310 [Penicillium diatomitis]|uniref:Uncharacterized protein n=1 Tax=Penicillium diatomitis TaxID=2819901 RepID=A0A9W9WLN4_9EURO|nr:uncharacterized protein N7539_009310 [Penicillium diatomitis]KAJ5469692.1 hypothetical protein N7539_009310 [Penicillium diatomitis]
MQTDEVGSRENVRCQPGMPTERVADQPRERSSAAATRALRIEGSPPIDRVFVQRGQTLGLRKPLASSRIGTSKVIDSGFSTATRCAESPL